MECNTKYKLAKGSQVREEDFGLLFYRMHGPRLYFLSSGDLISPDFFNGEMTLEEWLKGRNRDLSGDSALSDLVKMLTSLVEKGVVIEC
jgi:putative mycofactocin binding protein MftB